MRLVSFTQPMKNKKEEILQAAEEEFARNGYEGANISRIAKRVGVTHVLLYYHFQNIPALMEESVKEWMEDVIHRYGNLESPAYCLTYMAGECMKRKTAFLHLFRSAQKDVFLFSLNKMACGVVKAYVDEDEEYKESSSEGKERVIRCYKCLFVGIILDWLEENASFDLPEFCEEICKTLAESAPHMMGRYPNE